MLSYISAIKLTKQVLFLGVCGRVWVCGCVEGGGGVSWTWECEFGHGEYQGWKRKEEERDFFYPVEDGLSWDSRMLI
jgi:hypothetical protein